MKVPAKISWREGLFKVGLAASVAVVCVLFVQGSFRSISDGPRLADQNLIEDISAESYSASVVQTYETGLDAKAQELLKERTWDKIISDKVKELVDKNIVVLK